MYARCSSRTMIFLRWINIGNRSGETKGCAGMLMQGSCHRLGKEFARCPWQWGGDQQEQLSTTLSFPSLGFFHSACPANVTLRSSSSFYVAGNVDWPVNRTVHLKKETQDSSALLRSDKKNAMVCCSDRVKNVRTVSLSVKIKHAKYLENILSEAQTVSLCHQGRETPFFGTVIFDPTLVRNARISTHSSDIPSVNLLAHWCSKPLNRLYQFV